MEEKAATTLTIALAEEACRALEARVADKKRSIEAEAQAILDAVVHVQERQQLGTAFFSEIGRRFGLTNADLEALEQALGRARETKPAEPLSFD